MPSRSAIVRRWCLHAWPGRLLIAGAALKLQAVLAGLVVAPLPSLLDALGTLGSLLLIISLAYVSARGLVWAKRRLLWRVRRKLILSYVFIGFVPSLLIILFFLLSGLLLFFNVSAYLVQSRVANLTDQARFLAGATMVELQRSTTAEAVRETLERRQASTEPRYPFVSATVVPVSHLRCEAPPSRRVRLAETLPLALPLMTGPWAHLDAPAAVPGWITCEGFGGLLAYRATPADGADGTGDTRLVVRAVAVPDMPEPRWAVVLDLPLSLDVEARLHEETGIRLGDISTMGLAAERPVLLAGRALEARPALAAGDSALSELGGRWVAFVEYRDWVSGQAGTASLQIALSVWDIYTRLSTISAAQFGALTFSQVLLLLLAVVGILFLVIQGVALILGLMLARQITGAVHDLFTGTQHLRNRDFEHHIPVRARDQLGELAESFNLMTGEVTTLLREMAEKGRMEQEMLAAREIQQRLLPSGPLSVPGLAVNAFCEPAREVAGDYYDFLPITDTMLGVLIADVSGKGLAAGLYMAQLKVIVQSLARVHHEPRDFLIAVNRVVAGNIDQRSFITMAYAVIDLERRTMTVARAGHCPLLHVPMGPPGTMRKAQLIAPDGLVLGLQIDEGQMFDGMLQETTVPLAAGDVIVLFTDGISETMNAAFDCFGEARLATLFEQYAHLPFDQLRSYISAELKAFAAGADQHDDMTMILLRVEDLAKAGGAADAARASGVV
ncbi:MAG: PP2C family protein-serine/threonine phosphatase [Vicinamibacterales bacterium]|nr:PP2C family protein-serine/threonine phosphatase [Vicinamibacterales bacterium]